MTSMDERECSEWNNILQDGGLMMMDDDEHMNSGGGGGDENNRGDMDAYRLVADSARVNPDIDLCLDDVQPAPNPTLQRDVRFWNPEPKLRDYYKNEDILRFDREAEETPMNEHDPLLDAVPSPELAQMVFSSYLSAYPPWRHLSSSFNQSIITLARYIRRSKCFIDLIKRNDPPWKGMAEAEVLLKDEPAQPHPPPDLVEYVVKKGNYVKAYNLWHEYHLQRLHSVARLKNGLKTLPPGPERDRDIDELSRLLSEKAGIFQYFQHTAEVHYDNLKVYPPGCGPTHANLKAGSTLAWDGSIEGVNETTQSAGGPRQRMKTPEECMAKSEELQSPIWCKRHSFLVKRVITLTWTPDGIRKHEHIVRPVKRIEEQKWPRGEELFCGLYREFVGSFNCPSVPALLDDRVRRAQLDVFSTPYRLDEILHPGGYQLSSVGAPYVPAMYLSPVQHKVIICKSRNQMPMLIVHFVNYMTQSMDNVMLRIEPYKVPVYKRDDVAQATTVLKKNKTIIGTSGHHSVIGFESPHVTLRPDRYTNAEIPVLVAAANKHVPGLGNSLGFDENYQSERIKASVHHYRNHCLEQIGLVASKHPDHPEYDSLHPYDHSTPTLAEVSCKTTEKDRIMKNENLVYANPRCSDIIIMEVHIQRVMVRVNIMAILGALGVKKEEIHAMIGHGDEQDDSDDATTAVHDNESNDMGMPLDQTINSIDWNIQEEQRWQQVRRKVRMTDLHEKRRRYDDVISTSLEMLDSIPQENLQNEMIDYLGELYSVNIQHELRVKTVREYGLYFLEQCLLPMQGLLEQMKEDSKSDQPINVAVGDHGHFMGSHTMKNVVFDERTRFVFWKKAFSMCIYLINPLLRTMSGFRGQQYGRLYSQDEYQCNDIVDINNYHIRVAWRLIRDMYLKDIKSNLNALAMPNQWWFTPSEAYQRQLVDIAKEVVRADIHPSHLSNGTSASTSNNNNNNNNNSSQGDTYMMAAREEALAAAAVATSAASSSSVDASTIGARKLYQPSCLKNVLARTFQDAAPITKFQSKTTTKSEEDARRPGSVVKRPYNPFNIAAHWSQSRQVVAISSPHAGSRSREFQSNFEYLLDIFDTTTSDSSGQNNCLAAAATCSRNLTQTEHIEVHGMIKRLVLSGLLWAARDFYRQRVVKNHRPRVAYATGIDSIRGLLEDSDMSTESHYIFMYGSDLLGLVHLDNVSMLLHRLFMFKTHPNQSDGIRMLSIEVNHAQRLISIHFNRRLVRLTWVLEGKRLRAARVSPMFRKMLLMKREDLRADEWVTGIPLLEELWARRCIEFRGYDDTRHGQVGNSFAMLLENRQQLKEPPFLALELHPSANLGLISCARPFINHVGGARQLAAQSMSKTSNQAATRSWPALGKQKPAFTLVQPQHEILMTASSVVNRVQDGCHSLFAFYNSPMINNDASRSSRVESDFGGMMIMITEVVRSIQDVIRSKATRTHGELETKVQWAPTQVQKKQRELDLIRKTQQHCLEQNRQMPQLQSDANAATSIFASHDIQRTSASDLVIRHQNLSRTSASDIYVANEVLPVGAGSAATSVYQHATASGVRGADGGGGGGGGDCGGGGSGGGGATKDNVLRVQGTSTRWTPAGTKEHHTTYLLEQDMLTESGMLTDSLTIPSMNNRRESLVIPQLTLSDAPIVTWDMYTNVSVQKRFTLEHDVYIDNTNTVSMPAFLQPNQTLIRSVVLTSAMIDMYAARDSIRTENERMRQSMVMRLHRKLDARILQPVPDLPSLRYDNVVFRSKRLPMELLAWIGTWDGRGRIRLHHPMGLLHHEDIGDKNAANSGQKTTTSESTLIEDSIYATTDESGGMIPSRSLHTACMPTRKTISNYMTIVCGSTAATMPSHRFMSTNSTYRYAPSLFNDHLSQADLRAIRGLELNAHYLEALEARKNTTRFGKSVHAILRTWTLSACTRKRSPLQQLIESLYETPIGSMTRCKPILNLEKGDVSLLWTCDSHTVEKLENGIVRCVSAAMHHVARTWGSVDGGYQVYNNIQQQQQESHNLVHNSTHEECQDALSRMFRYNNDDPTCSFYLTHTAQHKNLVDTLRAEWWKAVYVETWKTMRIGDVFWAPLSHVLHQLQRDQLLLRSARDDMMRLADHMTNDLVRRVQLETLISSSSSTSSPLETIPKTLPPTFSACNEALVKYRLMIMDKSHMLALELVRLFPLVQRLDLVMEIVRQKLPQPSTSNNSSEMDTWKRFIDTIHDLCRVIREFANHIQLEPEYALTYIGVNRYVREIHLMNLAEDQSQYHVLCRSEYQLEDGTDDEQEEEEPEQEDQGGEKRVSFFTAERLYPWDNVIKLIEACTLTEMVGTDTYGLNQHNEDTDESDDAIEGIGVRAYGERPLGFIQHVRQSFLEQMALIVCNSLFYESRYLPIALWSIPQRNDRPIGSGIQSSWSVPWASQLAVSELRIKTIKTEWPGLVQALHVHDAAFHSIPSLVPELLRLSHRLITWPTTTTETTNEEKDMFIKAINMEIDSLLIPVAELACNGETGEQISMFFGPTHELSLHKIATDLMKTRSTGPVHFLSGQPASTSDGQGAGRMGRMELQAIAASGALGIDQTATSTHSDVFEADRCQTCGNDFPFNHAENTGFCNNCQKQANGVHVTVRSSQISNDILRIPGIHRTPILRTMDSNEEHINA